MKRSAPEFRASVAKVWRETWMQVENIKHVAGRLQQVRDECGFPIKVNSCFRSTAVNRAVGGVSVGISFKYLTSVMDLLKDSGLIVDDDWTHVVKVTSEAVNFGEDYAIVTVALAAVLPWYRRLWAKIFK